MSIPTGTDRTPMSGIGTKRRFAAVRWHVANGVTTDIGQPWGIDASGAYDPSRTSCSVGLPIAVDRLRGFNPRDAKDWPGHVPDSVAHRNLLRVTNPPRS